MSKRGLEGLTDRELLRRLIRLEWEEWAGILRRREYHDLVQETQWELDRRDAAERTT